jgi:hypothetical protein
VNQTINNRTELQTQNLKTVIAGVAVSILRFLKHEFLLDSDF